MRVPDRRIRTIADVLHDRWTWAGQLHPEQGTGYTESHARGDTRRVFLTMVKEILVALDADVLDRWEEAPIHHPSGFPIGGWISNRPHGDTPSRVEVTVRRLT